MDILNHIQNQTFPYHNIKILNINIVKIVNNPNLKINNNNHKNLLLNTITLKINRCIVELKDHQVP